jgi:hypothetical protein
MDPYAWDILEYYLTSSTTSYEDTLSKIKAYLGGRFSADEWKEATDALFSGDEDDALSLANFKIVRAKHAPSSSILTAPHQPHASFSGDEDGAISLTHVPSYSSTLITSRQIHAHATVLRSPPLTDPVAWDILEYYLTSKATTYGDTLTRIKDYLGDRFSTDEWKEATDALFSGDEDDAVSLANFKVMRAKHLPSRPVIVKTSRVQTPCRVSS